ncbi:hypothetical protein ACFX13_032164 [Malus domestica]
MVDLDSRLNSFLVNLDNKLDLPTPESPISTTLKRASDGQTWMWCRVDTLSGGGETPLATSSVSDSATDRAASASSTITSFPSPKVVNPHKKIVRFFKQGYKKIVPKPFFCSVECSKPNPNPFPWVSDLCSPLINGLRKVCLKLDENLKAYYWGSSNWALDF